jgi:ABC-type antimicrobial peptide transport system permease subunit
MRSVVLQIGIGLALGIPCALLAGHLMASQLFGVPEYDPMAIAGATGVLLLCAAVAGLIPARRASGIQPMQALRTE